MNEMNLTAGQIDKLLNIKNWTIKSDVEGHFSKCVLNNSVVVYFLSTGEFSLSYYGDAVSSPELLELGFKIVDWKVTSSSVYYHESEEELFLDLKQAISKKIFKKEDLNLLGDLNG